MFAAASDNQIAAGAQNTSIGNAANQYKIGRYVDLANTAGEDGKHVIADAMVEHVFPIAFVKIPICLKHALL